MWHIRIVEYNLAIKGNEVLNGMKEWSTRYNMDEPPKQHTKWKDADTKAHVSYDSIHMKYPDKAKP